MNDLPVEMVEAAAGVMQRRVGDGWDWRDAVSAALAAAGVPALVEERDAKSARVEELEAALRDIDNLASSVRRDGGVPKSVRNVASEIRQRAQDALGWASLPVREETTP